MFFAITNFLSLFWLRLLTYMIRSILDLVDIIATPTTTLLLYYPPALLLLLYHSSSTITLLYSTLLLSSPKQLLLFFATSTISTTSLLLLFTTSTSIFYQLLVLLSTTSTTSLLLLSTTSDYPICLSGSEDIKHMMFMCDRAKSVWQLLLFWEAAPAFFCQISPLLYFCHLSYPLCLAAAFFTPFPLYVC